MKTYPYQENGEIIELVRKDEHDAVVRELKKHLEDANRGAERNAHINRSFAGQINQLHSDVRELNERLTKQQSDMLDTIVQLRAELTNTHSILDGDESKIIRNAKDGYPEGREARVLTLAERVKSLCIYAADWKRWTEEKEVELTRWQSLAESLATALKDCKNRAMDKSIETHADDHAKGCMDDIWEWAESALAAYNSAKSGNLPDPLAEAVKRMEAVPEMELERVWSNAHRTRLLPCIEAVRARLISAAKGEQP